MNQLAVAVAEAAPSNHKQNSQLDTKEKFRAKKIRRLEPAGVVCYRVDPAGAQGEQTPEPSDPIEARQERCPRRNFGSLAPPVYSQFRQSLNPSWTCQRYQQC